MKSGQVEGNFHEKPGVRAKDSIPNFAIIGNSILWKVQVCHALRHLGGGGGVSRPTTRS